MRLIDANRLRIKCHTVNDLQPDKFVVSRMMVSSEAIDTEPTVKAIPIEWIEMFIQKYKICGDEEYKLFHFMLTEWKKWEKENERMDNR